MPAPMSTASTQGEVDKTVEDTLRQLLAWLDRNGLASYDYADILRSPVIRGLTFGSQFGQQVALQFGKRFPFNIRPLIGVTPHVAQNTTNRASAIDERTTRHPGYAVSQIIRKLIETIFGDAKEHGRLRQLKVRGLPRAQQMFTLAMTVVNLRRLPQIFEASG